MVESTIQTTSVENNKPTTHQGPTKVKHRKKIVWSVNVFTIVLYMVDPRYMLCEGKYKQVCKRFKKACEIVLRVVIHEASQYIEYSAPLVRDLERSYLESEAFTSIRRIWTILRSVKN